jgi:hypothetical protein
MACKNGQIVQETPSPKQKAPKRKEHRYNWSMCCKEERVKVWFLRCLCSCTINFLLYTLSARTVRQFAVTQYPSVVILLVAGRNLFIFWQY